MATPSDAKYIRTELSKSAYSPAGLPSGDMFASVQVVVHGYDSLRVQVNGKRRHGDRSLREELLTVVPLLGIADAWGAEVRL